VGDSKIAAGLGLRHKNCYSLILSSYEDSELARYGPGRAHLQHMLRYAIEHGFELFDLTIGDEPYKLSIMQNSAQMASSWLVAMLYRLHIFDSRYRRSLRRYSVLIGKARSFRT
jgi:CelD/BcsL family acetyltransferase involved in cellulose biosynthesis